MADRNYDPLTKAALCLMLDEFMIMQEITSLTNTVQNKRNVDLGPIL